MSVASSMIRVSAYKKNNKLNIFSFEFYDSPLFPQFLNYVLLLAFISSTSPLLSYNSPLFLRWVSGRVLFASYVHDLSMAAVVLPLFGSRLTLAGLCPGCGSMTVLLGLISYISTIISPYVPTSTTVSLWILIFTTIFVHLLVFGVRSGKFIKLNLRDFQD